MNGVSSDGLIIDNFSYTQVANVPLLAGLGLFASGLLGLIPKLRRRKLPN